MTAAVLPFMMQGRRSGNPFPRPKKIPRSTKDRLPAIAPRYQVSSDTDTFEKFDPTSDASVSVPRTRLPPRSRFGCWTCRTRKVKCDEARPECTPCSRLGHPCDYNPRLSFKDDTPRVLEKMSGVARSGAPVWDPSARRLLKRRRLNDQDDLLPPFSGLTNDEDREKKAEFRSPGTFLLVVNPDSFAEFDEYKNTNESSKNTPNPPPSTTSGSIHNPQFNIDQTLYNDPFADENEIPDDPDIVILKVFEDDSRKLLSPLNSLQRRATSSTPSLSITSSSSHQRSDYFRFSYDNTPLMRVANEDGRDHQLIYYYKNFVHRHLAQVHRDSLGTSMETGALSAPDVFERQAATFVPLYHALMAFSALSMSYKSGSPNLDALQHYQKALPSLQASLRTEADLISDGVFLTHFILLLYEISAGEPRGLSLWAQHIDQLLRITLLRHELYGHEPYTFIVWWVASIDTHSVLCGMGNGEFVETMLRNNLLPSGMDPQHPYQAYDYSTCGGLASSHSDKALPSALAFHRRISILAAELSLLARDLRAEDRNHPHSPRRTRSKQERIGVLQDTLRRTWNVQMPVSVANGYCNQVLPVGARGIFEHSFALYRACLIYSHTSMYNTQRTTSHPLIHEVCQSAGEILRLAREIVSSGHLERKFIIFPLFMAGFVSRSEEERREILGLVRRMEEDSVGRNFVAVRQFLEIVYERQEKRKRELREQGWRGGREDVDWVALIGEMGLQVVNCRL